MQQTRRECVLSQKLEISMLDAINSKMKFVLNALMAIISVSKTEKLIYANRFQPVVPILILVQKHARNVIQATS